MRLYLAASSAEIDRARMWRDRCVAAGIEVVSTWIESIERVGEANPRVKRVQRRDWADVCFGEIDHLVGYNRSAFWLLWPTTPRETGALVELGYLIGRIGRYNLIPRRLVISGDTERSIFCALGKEYATDEEAFAAILAEATPSDQRVTLLEVE